MDISLYEIPKELIIYEIFPHLGTMSSDAFRLVNKEFSQILKLRGNYKKDLIEFCFIKFYAYITNNNIRSNYVKYININKSIQFKFDQNT